jgi:hypothetical protein
MNSRSVRATSARVNADPINARIAAERSAVFMTGMAI